MKDWIEIRIRGREFFNGDLVAPGAQIKWEDGEENLIGDINDHGGFCNCCNNDYDFIVAYRDLIDMDEIE